jgi:NADH:ubiquinone oxidoreductase subunit 6 (subunit J)
MTESITFAILAVLTLFPAVLVVTSRNIFHAGLWLIPTLVGVAGLFLTLGAEFLAAIQILVYVGGIMVLLLFAILLTRGLADPEARVHNRQTVWAFICSIALLAVLLLGMKAEFGSTVSALSLPNGSTERMGELLLGRYLLPFEIASLILLAAIIGAIVLAKGEKA